MSGSGKEQEVTPIKEEDLTINKDIENKLEQLSLQETENLVKSFQEHFDDCTKACKKPNILLAGITGAGKSSLINAVFGEKVAESGAGMPVTQHFQKFEPKDKPVVIYDSKGLEWKEHKAFIEETGKFFDELRKKEDVSEHIHVVWYVINTGRGRIEDFEADIVRKVFNPTPVIFILNKVDLADSKAIKAVKEVIEKEKLPNNKGIHLCVANRKTYTQSWCPKCISDDVFFDEETKELECSECSYMEVLENTFGMQRLIEHTSELLPELAKDAFMYSQTASLIEKDNRAKEIVIETTKDISLDLSGEFIKKVAGMCAKLFVVWGWPLTAGTFKDGILSLQEDYLNKLKFQERLGAAALDKLLGYRLSKAFSGFIGYTMSRGMKRLNQALIIETSKDTLNNMKVDDFFQDSELDEEVTQMFFEMAIVEGVEKAISTLWDLSMEELLELKKQMVLEGGQDIFAGIDDIKKEELERFILQHETVEEGHQVKIEEIDSSKVPEKKIEKKEDKKEDKKETYVPEDLDLD